MFNHYSVMLEESINLLNIKPSGTYVDMTLGGAGHSQAIYNKLDNGRLICFDQDDLAISNAKNVFENKDNVFLINKNFANYQETLNELGINGVDGVIFDLGVSSMQFDIPERGFSYRFDAKLDMRMNQNSSLSAYEVVNDYSFHDLLRIISRYGEEKYAKQIARNIEKNREDKKIETTFELVEIIKKSLPQSVLKKKGHPAKKTFQAIRIEVNKELEVFEKALVAAIESLNVGGRVVVISFHSLEDRLCKNIFKEYTTSKLPKDLVDISGIEDIKYKLVKSKVVLPSESELSENSRSKSSKLRVIEKIKE
ncbi:16S rRNA (cytosine1402-N4)-methyltransferase [Bacilli bacterium PM5-3]|nr:16S rRNA (cytosine1402-N4)-methyltransferase [Bacilli bacterium PM5-3]